MLESFKLLLKDLFNGHDVFVAFLVDKLVDFFKEGFFDVCLLLLVDATGGRGGQGFFIRDTRVLGLELLDVVKDHETEGEGVQNVQELVTWKVHVGWEL